MLAAPVLADPVGVDACLALLSYEGAGRELVARLKYRNSRAALPGLAKAMASLVIDPGNIDVVTWAPTTPARRRQRGFDQAELLARAVARDLRRPCRRLLVRLPGQAQTGRPLAERRGGPSFRAPFQVPGSTVLVVDDVITSGATVAAAARALRQAGATSVVALAAARTPRPRAGLH
jgi:predicted amidophosphoribosyltransferase